MASVSSGEDGNRLVRALREAGIQSVLERESMVWSSENNYAEVQNRLVVRVPSIYRDLAREVSREHKCRLIMYGGQSEPAVRSPELSCVTFRKFLAVVTFAVGISGWVINLLGFCSSESSPFHSAFSPRQASGIMVMGSGLAVVGILLWRSRFSLKLLLVAGLLAAPSGLIPLILS